MKDPDFKANLGVDFHSTFLDSSPDCILQDGVIKQYMKQKIQQLVVAQNRHMTTGSNTTTGSDS